MSGPVTPPALRVHRARIGAMLHAALGALHANPLRTTLSALGVIIGVGAMVAVLSLSDGVERAFRERMDADGRLLVVRIAARMFDVVDGQFVPRETWVTFTVADAHALTRRLHDMAAVNLIASAAGLVTVGPGPTPHASLLPAPRGVVLRGVLGWPPGVARRDLIAGRLFTEREEEDGAHFLVTEYALAVSLLADYGEPPIPRGALASSAEVARVLGRPVWLRGRPWQVVGVLGPDAEDSVVALRAPGALTSDRHQVRPLAAFVPFTALPDAAEPHGAGVPTAARRTAPELLLVARRVENVGRTRAAATAWLAERFGAAADGPAGAEVGWRAQAEVTSYEREGDEARRGMLVLRLLMGTITGVSLVVGGVGIMNVLLASVSERTREIGVAKAVGARARDVALQFLAESVAIAGVGAVLGTLLGVAVAYAAAALMRVRAGVPVRAGLSAGTVLVATAAPLLIGLAFGLYPALRAARLSPIDAIRHE